MRKIFGTDGVRGNANQYPMTAEIALKIGMAAAIHLGDKTFKTNRVLIGKDTRLSGYLFENALTSGLASMGKNVMLVGPMPTPAVAMLTRSIRADLGIMISASHNPYYDNGIKLFDNNGLKLSDDDQNKIADLMNQDLTSFLVKSDLIGKVVRLKEAEGRYIEFIKASFPENYNLNKLKIVVDCANGASYKVAPTVLYELGAEVIAIGVNPNGLNINDHCGSTHMEAVRLKVLETGADLGIAFDGDADRVMLVDEKGTIIDGDKILAIIATRLKKLGKLQKNKVVGTVMANMGFENYLHAQGISVIRTAVGDRYVSEAMIEESLNLGGEQSGHVLLSDYNTTGDGLLVALQALIVLVESNKLASKVFNIYQSMPQVLKNFRYTGTNPLDNEYVSSYIQTKQNEYTGKARVLVRKSGTESLIRVMVEGSEDKLINRIADDIIAYIHSCN